MNDQYQFHLARAEAERVAADKATIPQARALHLQLAGLHLDHAMLLEGEVDEPLTVTVIEPRRRSAVVAVAVAFTPPRRHGAVEIGHAKAMSPR